MARTSIERESVEYASFPVTGPAGVTLDTLPFEVAVVPSTTRPTVDDWNTGEYVDGRIRLLVGPLDPGEYGVWMRVTSTPELPWIRVGRVTAR